MESARVAFKQASGRWPNWKETMSMMLALAKQEGKVKDISPYVDLLCNGSRWVADDGRTVGQIIYDLRHGVN
jgi:hypothetical protein